MPNTTTVHTDTQTVALIDEIDYSYTTGQMTVLHADGRRVRFYDVPSGVWRGLRKSPSELERYVGRNIDGKYRRRALRAA
jgi:hypothetical protein